MSSAVSGDADGAGAADDRGGARGLWLVVEVGEVGLEGVVDLAGDVALEAAEDLSLGLAFGRASLRVGAGALAVAQAADGDEVECSVGLAVAAVVEAVPCGLRAWRDRAKPAAPDLG